MSELTVIRVPRADPSLPPLVLDLSEIYVALGRKDEVATVNSHKAPELLSLFNVAYLNSSRVLNALQYELVLCEHLIREIKAIILMDRMKDILEKAGLANSRNPLGSEDVRQSVYERDPEYKRATTLAENLGCYITQVSDWRKFFQNAFDSVKKIMGSEAMGSYGRQNPNLNVPLSHPNTPAFSGPGTNNQALSEPPEDDFFGTAR
jgi:hypothetical protein